MDGKKLTVLRRQRPKSNLWTIVNSLWFVLNDNIHKDLDVPKIDIICLGLFEYYFYPTSIPPTLPCPTICQTTEHLPERNASAVVMNGIYVCKYLAMYLEI